jgi:signal transduction histidine kinase
MNSQRLSWRIGLPFALFVLAGSVALVLWMSWRNVEAERNRLASLARANADFIRHSKLPPSERMAHQLSEVLNARVVFVRRGPVASPITDQDFSPSNEVFTYSKTASAIRAFLPDDGEVQNVGFQHEAVRSPVSDTWSLALWWPRMWPWSRVELAEALPVLAAFWLLSLVVAWLISRSLVRPLQHLAAKLPDIEKPEPIDLPEAQRKDEIGDVARAFVRTREALQTERAERERAEKLAVLGRMTAALAHEIQNPVCAIKMHAQLWQGGGANDTAQIIEGEATRIESLVNQWMFLSKPQPPAISEVDLPTLLTEVVKAHQAQLDHAQVKVSLQVLAPVRVPGDTKRLAQVFSNLLVNAIQALPHGGELAIGCNLVLSHAEVTFTDTGKGFSNEALSRFSEFFFSEKEGGMGIGLSVASEIVKAHGGELRVANRAGGGACVTVTLPSIEPALQSASSASFPIAD